ncbi:MAG TPA: cyclic pyranopterin monophosphate synthase MoaC [Candidatus Acetothermia bacterium]|nr:cyclic pyranopterin monophosphate synthase MoaC [Candidatus Acetothermia bacterium]
MNNDALTHVDSEGRIRMVDVSEKPETARVAVARGRITMSPSTCAMIAQGKVAKGNVLTTAQVAGIIAAKRTRELIPLCHPIPLTDVEVRFSVHPDAGTIDIEATAKCVGRTGVEMEALTAVSVAALTIYDMAKAVERTMQIGQIRLVRKSGGKSGTFVRQGEEDDI